MLWKRAAIDPSSLIKLKREQSPPAAETARVQPSARLVAALLLFFMFALCIHVQSAKYRREFLFHTTHVLHGDLEVAPGKAGVAFTGIPGSLSSTGPVMTASICGHFSDYLTLSIVLAGAISLMKYLARLFRAPPAR